MAPTEITKKHVIGHYIQPARSRGETRVQVRVGNVLKELGWTNRTPSVFSTLASEAFQREAGVELVEKSGGPDSGGPSTTWRFTYKIKPAILDSETSTSAQSQKTIGSLMDLCGIFEGGYDAWGGSDAFMKRERDWGPDAWERYEAEQAKPGQGKA